MVNRIKLDTETFPYIKNVIESGMGRELTPEEGNEILENGIPLVITGGPKGTFWQNYAFFYRPPRRGNSTKPKLGIDGYFSTEDHTKFIREGYPLFGGTIDNEKFDGVSQTWINMVGEGSIRYNFGLKLNRVMLNHFGLKE